ncbi:hypothetical protein CPB84DRAFT_1965734 [Gymnopilus junonius]|uniref:Uncharacterized protein n=1 Tax=Gymnopilus junonius TaxID=109634 RepID=A0A9P5NE17_GYMJU|nr:hypothetical protein CPB84DRAFT_1965734 [Gymnopilus junonius]
MAELLTCTMKQLSSRNMLEITLLRSQSFPAPRSFEDHVTLPRDEKWAPLSLPKDGAHLELELTDSISEGRIGLAYSVRIINDSAHLDLPDLCIKLLAREQGYEGVVTPRCFGFFTVPLKDCLDAEGRPVSHIKPWENITIHPKPDPDWADKREDTQWWLPDDPPSYQEYYDDSDGWKSGSPWNKWRSSPSDPLISILVWKSWASPTSVKIYARVRSKMTVRSDMRDLVRDVTSTGIVHDDLRYCNFVRATRDVVCPRHQRAHRWRLIDFDTAMRIRVTPENPGDIKYAMNSSVWTIGQPYFWGWS